MFRKRGVKSHRKIRTSFPFLQPGRRPCLHVRSFRNSSTMKVRVFLLSIVRKSSRYVSRGTPHTFFSSLLLRNANSIINQTENYRGHSAPETFHHFDNFLLLKMCFQICRGTMYNKIQYHIRN